MTDKSPGILHPGLMGISVANALVVAGHKVGWASENRSQQSTERAEKYKLHDYTTLTELCAECEVIFCVCPPSEALNVANSVANKGFTGTYVDCNAVSPQSSRSVADVMHTTGADYVDGGIIGPPAWKPGTTRLYLSGHNADRVADLFEGSLMETVTLGEAPDAASAMKMAYAAWTKGSAALLLSVYALAEHHGLGKSLIDEWHLSQPGLEKQLTSHALGNAPKAWRFTGEMQQIANTLSEAGQHPGAFESAASIYEALSLFKSTDKEKITRDAVIDSIIKNS